MPLRIPSRKVLGAAMAIVLAGAMIFIGNLEPGTPPPVIVSLARGNAPLQVFPSIRGILMILPDGSLN